MSDPTNKPPTVTLASASEAGLVLDFGDRQQRVTWFEVEDIAVGTRDGPGGGVLFTLAMELANGRMLVVGEGQPVWRSLIEALPLGLPDVMPFGAWSEALVGAPPAVIVIYSRQPMGTA